MGKLLKHGTKTWLQCGSDPQMGNFLEMANLLLLGRNFPGTLLSLGKTNLAEFPQT